VLRFNSLHHTATHCTTLYNTLQHTATHCNTLQHTATHCTTGGAVDVQHIRADGGHCPDCCTATHFDTLHHAATHSTTLQHTAPRCNTYCNTLQHTAKHCNAGGAVDVQHIRADGGHCPECCTATHCNTLHHTATHCTTLQHTAPHCNSYCTTLQHTATQVELSMRNASGQMVDILLSAAPRKRHVDQQVCCSVLQRVAACCSVLQCAPQCRAA